MDLSLFLGLLGVVATILFGIWGVYLAIIFKYPAQITFAIENVIALFDNIVKNVPDLTVNFRGNPVTPSLVLLKGCLINSGKKDITASMVENKLHIIIPKNYKWQSIIAIGNSDDVKYGLKILSDNEIEVTTGLFRRNECIRFESIIQVPDDLKKEEEILKAVKNNFTFKHRIAETRKVNKQEITEVSKFWSNSTIAYVVMFAVMLSFTIGLLIFYNSGKCPATLNIPYSISDNKIIMVEAKPFKDQTVRLEGVDTSFTKIVTLNEFNNLVSKKCKIIAKKDGLLLILPISCYLLLPLLIIVYRIRNSYLYNKHKKLIA